MFFFLVLFLKNATQYHGSTKIFPYSCLIAHPNNEAWKRCRWGNISLDWLPSVATGTEHVLALEHCWLLNVRLYGNMGCRLTSPGTWILQDTRCTGDPFLLTQLLYGKILHTGSELGPPSFALLLLLFTAENANWHRKLFFLPRWKEKKKTPTTAKIYQLQYPGSYLRLSRASLGHLISLLQLPLSLLSQFNINNTPTKNFCPG